MRDNIQCFKKYVNVGCHDDKCHEARYRAEVLREKGFSFIRVVKAVTAKPAPREAND